MCLRILQSWIWSARALTARRAQALEPEFVFRVAQAVGPSQLRRDVVRGLQGKVVQILDDEDNAAAGLVNPSKGSEHTWRLAASGSNMPVDAVTELKAA